MKKNLALAAIVAATALTLSACSGSAPSVGADSVTSYTFGAQVDVPSFNPADASGATYSYLSPLYDSVLRFDTDGSIVAGLATEWAWDDAKTTLDLTLHDGITFSDDSVLDATAVKTALESNAAGSGIGLTNLSGIATITAVDATHLTISLSEPDPGLEAALASESGMIAGPLAIQAGTLATTPVGSGAYVLDAAGTTAGTVYSYQKRDDAWEADAFALDSVEIRFLNDDTARFNALASGEVDAIVGVGTMLEQSKSAGYAIETAPGPWHGLMISDRAGEIVPALGDVRVRQAINYAIDRESILETLYSGQGTVTDQMFSPASTGYDDALNDEYSYDPEKAKELMAEAGYADGITVPTFSTAFMDSIQPTIEANLAAIGITLAFDRQPIEALFGGGTDNYPLYFWYYGGSPDSWQTVTGLIAPDAAANVQGTTDDTITSLIAEIRVTSGDEQAAAYQALNAHIVEQAWAAPFLASDSSIIHDGDFGYTPTTVNVGDLRTITPTK